MRLLDAFHRVRQPRTWPGTHAFVLAGTALLALGAALPLYGAGPQQGSALAEFQTSGGSREGNVLTFVEGTIARLKFTKGIATGQVSAKLANGDVAEAEPVTADEILVRAKKVGRTNLIVWFREGNPEAFDIVVRRDLSVLEGALKAIHPSLSVSAASDRQALVLTGTVPDGATAARAERAAHDYASAGVESGKEAKVLNLIRVQAAVTSIEQGLQAQLAKMGAADVRVARVQRGPAVDDATDVFVLSGSVDNARILDDATDLVRATIGDEGGKKSRIVNQIQVADRPSAVEVVIERAIQEQLGLRKVQVNRVAGAEADGGADILVMTGKVPSQTALMRALTLAAKVYRQQDLMLRKRAGEIERITETFAGGLTRTTEKPLRLDDIATDIRVAADESGALYDSRTSNRASTTSSTGLRSILSTPGGGLGGSGSSGIGRLLENRIDTNIGRAKALELADGRILSFIQVEDIPQVRVAIRLLEVSRNDLLNWDSNIRKLGAADFDTNGINPNTPALASDGSIATNANGEPILFASNTDVSNVVSFLEGGFTNQVMVGGQHFNLDAVFNVLETEGIARALASPTLTVLSGEIAAFGDGGSVSITSSVTTPLGVNDGSTGVFQTVQQLPFGIQLAVRPLVDEDGYITLDVAPSVSNPDFQLTALVRSSTGTPQETVAFAEKNLRTSARLRDGEVMLIGGLTDRSRKDQVGKTPWLHQIPLLGWLFTDKRYEDSDRELVIVVNPSIVRDRPTQARLWAYPSTAEMLGRGKKKAEAPAEQPADGKSKAGAAGGK